LQETKDHWVENVKRVWVFIVRWKCWVRLMWCGEAQFGKSWDDHKEHEFQDSDFKIRSK